MRAFSCAVHQISPSWSGGRPVTGMSTMSARCASGRLAIVQGVDHLVPVDIYLPGCPPRPEKLLDAIIKLHDKIENTKLGVNRDRQITELEQARLRC